MPSGSWRTNDRASATPADSGIDLYATGLTGKWSVGCNLPSHPGSGPARATLCPVSTVLATLPDDVARKVVDDVRAHGAGYVRIDAEGRAHYVPCDLVVDPAPATERGDWRMHE